MAVQAIDARIDDVHCMQPYICTPFVLEADMSTYYSRMHATQRSNTRNLSACTHDALVFPIPCFVGCIIMRVRPYWLL